jgi:hypothetical protein
MAEGHQGLGPDPGKQTRQPSEDKAEIVSSASEDGIDAVSGLAVKEIPV